MQSGLIEPVLRHREHALWQVDAREPAHLMQRILVACSTLDPTPTRAGRETLICNSNTGESDRWRFRQL